MKQCTWMKCYPSHTASWTACTACCKWHILVFGALTQKTNNRMFKTHKLDQTLVFGSYACYTRQHRYKRLLLNENRKSNACTSDTQCYCKTSSKCTNLLNAIMMSSKHCLCTQLSMQLASSSVTRNGLQKNTSDTLQHVSNVCVTVITIIWSHNMYTNRKITISWQQKWRQ